MKSGSVFCEVEECSGLAENVFSIWLKADREIIAAAQPGRFLHILCPEGSLLRRPISICQTQGDMLRLVFEVKGEGTRWLSRRRRGDSLDILGPLGSGFDLSGGPLLLAGGGIGAAPLLFCAQMKRCDAVLGFASGQKAVLLSEFASACDGAEFSSDDGSLGRRAYVTELLEERLRSGGYKGVLACGPEPMLRIAAGLCRDYSVPLQVSLEQRMGCGVGACLVCSCRIVKDNREGYARVCRDGPVFRASEVVWDD